MAQARDGPEGGIAHLEGQGDLESRSKTPRTHIVILVMPMIN